MAKYIVRISSHLMVTKLFVLLYLVLVLNYLLSYRK